MKKIILLLTLALVAFSATADATVTGKPVKNSGGVQLVSFQTKGLAVNAIDTLVVTGPLEFDITPFVLAAADTGVNAAKGSITLTFNMEGLSCSCGAGTTDSIQVAVDVSSDALNWVEAAALGHLMTNAAPSAGFGLKIGPGGVVGLKTAPVALRLRYKDTGAGTGKSIVTAAWDRPANRGSVGAK